MRVRVYIAGPMTGYENFNREAFHRAEDALKREGHTVLNPAVLPDGLTQPHYMDIFMAQGRASVVVRFASKPDITRFRHIFPIALL